MSFYTSITGLTGAQTQMSTISNNIANAETDGFKSSRVNFGDIMTSGVYQAPSQQVGSGTAVTSIQQQFSQGSLQQTSSALDLAISGEGFFAVKPSLTSTAVNYTRNGSFSVDADRYVTDANGNYLQVYPVDGSGTVVSGATAATQSLQLPLTSGDPVATTALSLGANLPASATDMPATTTFDRFDSSTYTNSTTSTIYDSQGNAQTVSSYYTKLTSPTGAHPTSTWAVHTYVGDQEITPASGSSPEVLTFDTSGKLTSPSAPVSYGAFTSVAGGLQAISINYGGSTTGTGSFALNSTSQDGVPTGELENVTVDNDGVVTASFSNGTTKALGALAMATFSNEDGLKQDGNSIWSATGASGSPIMGQAGSLGVGNIQSGALESSNVDLTSELVNLITAQRYFQANSKAIETQSDLLEGVIDIR